MEGGEVRRQVTAIEIVEEEEKDLIRVTFFSHDPDIPAHAGRRHGLHLAGQPLDGVLVQKPQGRLGLPETGVIGMEGQVRVDCPNKGIP